MARATKKNRTKLNLSIVLLMVTILGVVIGLQLTNTINIFPKTSNQANIIKKVGTSTPTPKPNTSASTSTLTKSPSSDSTIASGGYQDTNGSTQATSSPNQWATSLSGNITLKQPLANSTLQSGAVISGSAKISQVNFRLIDNQVGVIDQGAFSVTNGNFSGMLYFQPHASTGRIDVFSTEPDGAEINEIQVSVNF